jgi:Virulence-associated protein E/Bifunctional DNA primase/polymerase, N-terminal/Primase C terminal 2 (PriCT-2)
MRSRLRVPRKKNPPSEAEVDEGQASSGQGDTRQIPCIIAIIKRSRGHGVNVKLEAALAYSRMHWRIFPCHSIVEGRCSCGKADCGSPGKHPRTRGGFKDATDDLVQLTRWWTKWPDANIALATGSGLVVFDIDGEAGRHEFKELVKTHGASPATLTSKTGRGAHLVYHTRPDSPEVRSSARDSVHVRGEGGYVILPPSNHISGNEYKWIAKHPIALLPEWMRQWSQGYDIARSNAGVVTTDDFRNLGPIPEFLRQTILSNQRDITKSAQEALKTVWSPAEQSRLISALSAIDVKACGYEDYLRIGFALHSLGWDRSDGTSIAFDIWDEWCAQSEHYNQAGLEAKWKNFDRTARGDVNIGTLYHLAQQRGWNGGAPDPTPKPPNGVNGFHALPAAFLNAPQAIHFPDVTEDGKPKVTCTNAGVAVTALGIHCRKDTFHEKMLVAGEPINQWSGDLSDEVIQMIRKVIRYKYGFDPKVENTRDACVQLCLQNQFNPVTDYLKALQWDGQPRLDTWMTSYMGAADSELTRAIGRLSLIAAVRRARYPGTKFDQIIVLEGTEGRGKSSAIEILAGKENFSDQKILGLSDKEQQEAISGIWLYEIAELTGMRRADTDHVKAFASRTVDRARPAYGRMRVDRPRCAICFASTNDDEYLKSETGNRRFWPVGTGRIDLDALRRDRDQLWAEAATCETRGDSIGLPERLWKAAGEEQSQRLESDEWAEAIHNYLNMPDKIKYDISVLDVLAGNQFLQIEASRIGRAEQMRAGNILRRMGFLKYRKRLAGNVLQWRYRRPD